MNEKLSLDRAFPALAATADLQERVTRLAVTCVHRRAWKKVPILVAAFAATAFGLFIFAPRIATARTLSQIQAAYDRVNSFRMVSYLVDDSGKLTLSSVTECLNNKVREERGKEITFSQPDSTIVYKPGLRTAVRYKNSSQRRQLDGMRNFLVELKKANWVKGLSIDNEASYQGQPAIEVAFEGTTEPSRMRIYADKASMLPFRGEVDWRNPDGSWRLERVIEISYDAVVDSTRVEPNIPDDILVVDNEQLKEIWRKKLENGIITINKGTAHVVIRDALVLASGDIMVLYTNGMKHVPFDQSYPRMVPKPSKRMPVLVDASYGGQPFIAVHGLQGTMYTTKDDFVRGYLFSGEDLQAAWFAPLHPKGAMTKATLRFEDRDVSISKTIDLREAGEVPEWNQLVGSAPREAMEVEAQASQYRAQYFMGRDYAAAEAEITKSIRLNDLRMAQIGERMLQGDSYGILGSALHQQGKDKEARVALERAIHDDPQGKHNYQLILDRLEKP